MTYRKLFRLQFVGSMLLLGGVWWFSLGTLSTAGFSCGALALDATSIRGTLCFNFSTIGPDNPEFFLTHLPASALASTDIYPPDQYRPTGEFRMGLFPPDENAPDGMYYFYLQFPVWFLWLVFNAACWVGSRKMEKRSAAGREKELATGEAAG